MSYDDPDDLWGIDWSMFKRSKGSRSRPRVRYKTECRGRKGRSKPIFITHTLDEEPVDMRPAIIKNEIKTAILENPEITLQELKQKFQGLSLVLLAKIRSDFRDDLRLLQSLGKLNTRTRVRKRVHL